MEVRSPVEVVHRRPPARVDVKRLLDEWPPEEMQPGQQISYEQVEAVAQVEWRTKDWYTITRQWRAYLQRECGVVVDCPPEGYGKYFLVLDESGKVEKMGYHERKIKSQGGRIIKVAVTVDRNKLSDDEKCEYDKKVRNAGVAKSILNLHVGDSVEATRAALEG